MWSNAFKLKKVPESANTSAKAKKEKLPQTYQQECFI